MEPKQRAFIENLEKACKTHDDWLALINFVMPAILKDQLVLIEVVIREAERQVERGKGAGQPIAGDVFDILSELGLRLQPAS